MMPIPNDLFRLSLVSLKKKYGGKLSHESPSPTETWSMVLGTLGLSPVYLTVSKYLGEDRYVHLAWGGMILFLYNEFRIPLDTHPTKVRWFVGFVELFQRNLKQVSPEIYGLVETHEKEYRQLASPTAAP